MLRGKNTARFTTSESGMTLLEVAIGMIILGLLVTAMLPFYKLYRLDKVHMATLGNIADTKRALTQYALINDGYPRPAQRNLVYTDANYGTEFAGVINNCVINDPNVCRLNGVADKVAPAGVDPVLRGDVPFATLGLPYTSAVDGYGNRLTYSVTESLTAGAPSPFSDANGVIRIQDETGNATPDILRKDVTTNAHFVIISHGRNGVGTFTQNGVLRAACNVGDNDLGRDRENCDLDAIYTNNFIVFTKPDGLPAFARVRSDVPSTAYYDDYADYSEVLVQGTWLRSGASVAAGPNFTNSAALGGWAIKIGDQKNGVVPYHGATANSPPFARVNVVGTDKGVSADRVNINKICDLSTAACNTETHIGDIKDAVLNPRIPVETFNPAILGVDGVGVDGTASADGGGITCGSEDAMTGIVSSEEDCFGNDDIPNIAALSGFINNFKQGSGSGCPALKFAQGVDALGNLVCIDPP
jgi:type II secretory pathway pseudopilin PulG